MHYPARKTDPNTSHEAARHVVQSGKAAAQQAITTQAVKQHPGMTSLELASRANLDRYMLARRLPECEKAGTVVRGPAKACAISGRSAHTWRPSA